MCVGPFTSANALQEEADVAPGPSAPADKPVETEQAEIARLRKAYQDAQDTIATMKTLRRSAAARLLELGQRGVPESIAEPWTRKRLEEEIALREDDFYQNGEEIGADEDASHTQRFDATYIKRLKDALEGERPCDATGYIAEDGTWIEWIPADEELEDFSWEKVGFSIGRE